MSKLLSKYENGNYTVRIYDDGTKIRETDEEIWKPEFPECIDLTVTEKCRGGCPFCYAQCWDKGPSMDLKDPDIKAFIKSLHPFTEVAVNLNDMSWPELPVLLRTLKEHLIITNGTINAKHLSLNNEALLKTWQQKKMIYGIGVSANHFAKDKDVLCKVIPNLDNVVVHIIAGITDNDDIDAIINFQLRHRLKLLVLGYKKETAGKANQYYLDNHEEIDANINLLKNRLEEIKKHVGLVAFDNLGIIQTNAWDIVPIEEREGLFMGLEGEFTYFANLVRKKFGISSMISEDEMHNLLPDSVECFRQIRKEAGF